MRTLKELRAFAVGLYQDITVGALTSLPPPTSLRVFVVWRHLKKWPGWDVMWQMRGLALSRPSPKRDSSPADLAAREKLRIKLTMGPRQGLVALNGRPGHVQVPSTDVLIYWSYCVLLLMLTGATECWHIHWIFCTDCCWSYWMLPYLLRAALSTECYLIYWRLVLYLLIAAGPTECYLIYWVLPCLLNATLSTECFYCIYWLLLDLLNATLSTECFLVYWMLPYLLNATLFTECFYWWMLLLELLNATVSTACLYCIHCHCCCRGYCCVPVHCLVLYRRRDRIRSP